MPQSFVSFADVKRAVSIEAVLARYGMMESLVKKGQNLAGACPFCRAKSARQFQVNLSKNAWYCFGCKAGGNVLDFVAKKEGGSVRAAAITIDSWFELGLAGEAPSPTSPAVPATPSGTAPPVVEAPPTVNPPLTFTLKTLDPHYENLERLAFQASTLKRFEAGYCSKGLMKGRLAIPIKNGAGEIVAYAGLAADEGTTPRYLFPPSFHPELEVMNLHCLSESGGEDGPLYLVPEIEGVLRLAEAGVGPVLGLFDGTLSETQEEAVRGVLTLYDSLVLMGEGFADRTVARLARHTSVAWL